MKLVVNDNFNWSEHDILETDYRDFRYNGARLDGFIYYSDSTRHDIESNEQVIKDVHTHKANHKG